MKLQGKNLAIQMHGADVKLLQTELRQLGYTISQDESARSFFASTTQQAVSAFQRSNRLPVTGIVNERTARLINTKIDALQPQRFTVHGTVTRSDGAPLAGATVRAVDWDRAGEDSLGEATIQSDGRYEISYTADQFRRSPSEVGGPDLIVRVYDAQGLLLANSPRKNNAQADETIDLTVPVLEQKPFADSFVVRGQILKADGSPLTGGIVRAFDKDLRHEQPLGEQTTTDEEGRYEITYTRAQFRRTGKKRADLIVRVFDGEELLLAASQVIFNARPVEVVDLEISWDEKSVLSEYEHIMKEIAPLLADQQIADLKEDSEDKPEAGKFQDISFLSGETGINTQHLSFLVIAAKLSRQTQTAPEIFYGLFRQNIPTALSSLLAQDIQTHRIALKTSLSDCIIPSHFQDELEKNLQTLHSLPEGEIFKKPTFLVKPDVLFNNLTDLSRLDRKEADFIGIKLNEYFCSELLNAIGTVSEPMKTSLKSAFARIGYQTFKDSELFEVMLENILPEIKKDRTLTQEVSEIEKRLANRPSQKISELLHLNVPSRDNPILHFEFRKAKTLTYANLVKLSDEVVQQLMEKNLYLDDADETMLADLVREKIISSQQKADLKLTIDLGRLTGDNIPFIKAIKTPEITSIANIVSWEKADWQRLMTAANIPLPPGETSETYTENILLNIEKTYPSQVLFSTLLNARQIARVKKLDSLNPLLSSHDKLIDGKSPARIDWGNIAAEGSESLQQDLQDLTAFANTYRHLDIAELINDKNFDLAQKKEAINGRLQLLDTFYNNNPMLDLRLVNLVDNNAARLLNWQNISEADQPRLRKQLMAYQRILNLAEETSDRQVLLSKGYDSAVAIARQTEAQFSKTSDLPSGKNRLIYAKAQEVSLSLAHSHEMIRDTIRGSFKHLAMAYNLNPTLFNDLRDVAGFEELFEPQDFCACEECKSILSPAAYFVDLMHFIEQYISNPVFSSRFDHPLYLKRRRGDLWKLNLTCENTYTLVPQLIIVNEILETYLEGVVHGDIFERLSRGSEKMSFTLPFNLPLEELRIYLNHFGISTHMLYKTLLQPYQKIWRARLNLSEEEYTVIITPDFAGVKFRFGDHGSFTKFDVQDFIRYAGITRQQLDDLLALTFNPDLHNIKVSKDIQPYELQNFPEVLLYLTRNRLDFIHRFIRLWRKTEWTIPELDLILSALKDAKLIRQRGKFSNNKGLNKDAVLYVAQLIDLQESLKLTVEELCGMVHQLPVSDAFPLSPVKQSDKKLFERLFDVQTLFKHEEDCLFGWEEVTGNDSIKFIELLGQIFDIEWDNTSKIEKIENGKAIRVSTPKNNLSLRLNDKKTKVSLEIDDGRSDEFISKMKNGKLNIYHETSFSFHHYSLNKNNSDDHEIDSNTPILLGGLGISETELLLLFDLLKDEMPFNNNGDTRLNVRKISLLYRHARLAKALKLSVEEFIQVLHLNFAPTGLPITALDQIYQLNEFRDWLKSSPFSVYELRFIVQGKESNAVKYTINSEGIVELVKDIQKQNPLFFGEELLAEIEKISPEDSRKILVQMSNDNFIIASAEGYRIDPVNYRLTQDFSSILATSGVSAEVRAQEPEIREKLNEFHPFVISFTSKTNIGKELYHQLVKFINVDMGSDDFINYLQATFDEGGVPENPGDLDILLELSKEIERTMSLFEKLKFELKAITYITKNPAVLGIADLKDLTVNDLKAMVLYKKLISLNQEAESSVQKVLNNYQAKSTFSEDEVHLLAEFWQEDKSLLDSLIRSLTLSTVPIQALAYLKEGLDICRTLGINGFSLQKLADDGDFTRLSTARDIALGAFSSKYEDENIRQEKLEPYQDRINVIKRDALCDYIIARERELKFKDSNDIYAFFLLDVEMNGCFRISRLVCAISSLQLYVHRVLTNLEQSASDGCTVLNKVKNLSSFKNEWEWRKNYRVWEANRKVFLYPENYLEPDLRDNKTPIFKELEDELLQQKITKESAESAYKKYISQFTELARLRITGNYCHEESNKNHIKKSNTYYFFGRTQQDPPQYYYRTWDEKLWTPWEKIELGINSNYVSAVIHLGKLYLFWVEIKTTEKTDIIGGNSSSSGYTYDIDILYSFLNENGRWIPPQRLDVYHQGEPYYDEIYSAIYKNNDFEKQRRYKRLYPGVTQDGHLFAYVLFPATVKGGKINLFLNAIHEVDLLYDEGKYLYSLGIGEYLSLEKNQSEEAVFRRGTVQFYTAALHDATLISKYEHNLSSNSNDVSNVFDDNIHQSDIDIVHNKKCDYIIKIGNQQYLAQWKDYRFFHARGTVRLSTSLIDALGESLFTKGLENFLSLETQSKTEHSIGIDLYWPWRPPYNNNSHIDFRGAYGEYYRELFFHIPFLIANHLNANQKFKEAKWWYERIFDPTASESPDDENPIDRNWRYIEFKDVSLQTMKENLTDKATIEQYKTDPFSPHAIARMRLSAYQKGIVMKYIDNLLDWGDSLFAMDTMESINEATMLYVLASDILGKRPAQLGKCETVKDTNLTYEKIGPEMDKEVDILLCLENWNISISDEYLVQLTAAQDAGSSSYEIFPALSASLETEIGTGFAAPATSLPGRMDLSKITPQYQMRSYQEIVKEKGRYQQLIADLAVLEPHLRYPAFEVTGQSKLVFCVPPNYDLLKYWDRVEDRLFKIRNCMNISGVRRQLALFQPPINPMALVRAKAAGLSLEDILTMLEAQIPPYRFSYLIEKAKQYTQTVQAFGSALLIALEKRDVEELTLLRSVHERNILRETKEIKKQQLQEAQYQYQVIVETKTNVQNRINYYQGLIDEGLIVWENVQLISKHAGTVLMAGETVLRLTSGITYLVPQVGSPFAMKFGGKEIGDSQLSLSELSANLSRICDAISASAGLEASYQRREQEWGHQLLLAQQELKQVEQQRLSADIRQLIAEKDLEIHEKNMEQADELHDFYKNKFTSLGLYNYLSTTLNRLYREAYNMAYDMAKMAERTYRFERDEDDAIFITGDNWQFDRAGLLAGERLLLQLQHMERAYLEQNKRDYEVTQSFSLALMDPSALLKLREKGSCDFPIPEIIFDLFYPGQYKRLIKSVRVTIPCITGSYTNVSATLTLTGSYVRKEKSIDLEDLILKPNQESTSIATSNAQNDGGLFELNFRDERYLPFEGAGAISTWKLELPDKLRPFNYDTISDVIIHISYTARYDGEFRKIVEKNVLNILSNSANNECLFRLLSLKHEFPDAFYKLLNPSGTTQTTEFELTRQHFPQFLAGKDLSLSEMRIYLKPKGKEKVTTSGLVLKINNSPPIDSWNDFIVTSEEGDLKESIVSATYNPIRNWTIDTVSGGLNKEEIDDIMILLKYKIIL